MRTYPFRVEQIIDRGEKVSLLKQYIVLEVQRGVHVTMVRKRLSIKGARGAIVLIHGFAQNRYSFHTSHRSLSTYLASKGFDTFSIDLRNHGRSRIAGGRNARTFIDYGKDLTGCIDEVVQLSEKKGVFLLGHNLGGPVAFYALSKRPERIKGVVTISGIFTFANGNNILKILGLPISLLEKAGVKPFINVGIPFDLNGGMISLLPRSAERFIPLLPLSPWLRGSISLDVFKEWAKTSFEPEPLLIVKEMLSWGMKKRFVPLRKEDDFIENLLSIQRPFLFISGDRDLLLPTSNVEECYRAIGSRDKTLRIFSKEKDGSHFGHIDLILGDMAPKKVWPFILSWLEERLYD